MIAFAIMSNAKMPPFSDRANAFITIFETPLGSNDDGPLAGLTAAVKDNFDIAGFVTGNGNPVWREAYDPASGNAGAVDLILKAGASIAGKAHMDEFAYSLMGTNRHYGTPMNTATPNRVPGGSSSGSAAAVAAGLVDFALGTDTGGSVRLPASFCGLYGMRPSHGAVPIDGVVPLAPGFDTVGWLARDAATLAKVGRALGLDGGQPFTSAWLPGDLWDDVDPLVFVALRPIAETLAERIGSVSSSPLPIVSAAERAEAFRFWQGRDAWTALGGWISAHDAALGSDIAARFAAAKAVDDAAFARADAARAEIARIMESALSDGALIIIPTGPGAAPLLTASPAEFERFRAQAIGMLSIAGHAGLPQISIPAATLDGAPIGLSVIGRRGSDAALLSLVEAFGDI